MKTMLCKQTEHGKIMEKSWKIPERQWKNHGNFHENSMESMEILWKILENSIDIYGNSMENSGNVHGQLWKFYGNFWKIPWKSMEILWKKHGNYLKKNIENS